METQPLRHKRLVITRIEKKLYACSVGVHSVKKKVNGWRCIDAVPLKSSVGIERLQS